MAEHRVLLDTFADAWRTWDDLVGLQPDVMAGSCNLREADLVELERRVGAHQVAIDMLADALETEPLDAPAEGSALAQRTGISNRESARDEAHERKEHPPLDTDSPAPEDAAGRVGKAGSRSIAQKEAESRYPDRSMPASRKVAGAFVRSRRLHRSANAGSRIPD